MEASKHTSRITKMKKQRNAAFYLLRHTSKLEPVDISREVSSLSGEKIDVGTVMNSIIVFHLMEIF